MILRPDCSWRFRRSSIIAVKSAPCSLALASLMAWISLRISSVIVHLSHEFIWRANDGENVARFGANSTQEKTELGIGKVAKVPGQQIRDAMHATEREMQRIIFGFCRHALRPNEPGRQAKSSRRGIHKLEILEGIQSACCGLRIPTRRLIEDKLRNHRAESWQLCFPPSHRDLLAGHDDHVTGWPRG